MTIESTFPLLLPHFVARVLLGNGTDPDNQGDDAEEDHAYDAHNVLLLNVRYTESDYFDIYIYIYIYIYALNCVFKNYTGIDIRTIVA